jgi:hypothetical protein
VFHHGKQMLEDLPIDVELGLSEWGFHVRFHQLRALRMYVEGASLDLRFTLPVLGRGPA